MSRLARGRAVPQATNRLRELVRIATNSEPLPGLSPDALIDRLRSAVMSILTERESAAAEAAFLRNAIRSIPHAVVISGSGHEHVRSGEADLWLAGGASSLIPSETMTALEVQAIETGLERCAEVQLFGPPRKVLRIRSHPIPQATPLAGSRNVSGVERVVSVIDDVTDRSDAETVRRDLVTNISHELRTPVGAISLLAETLADEHDPVVIRRLATRIETEAQRLAETVSEVLALSQLESTATHKREEEIHVGALVRQTVARLTGQLGPDSVEVVVREIDEGLVVNGDRSLLTMALANLVVNAVKYSDKGKPVVVAATLGNQGREAAISVTDEGIGIPPRERQRIFERFYRIDRARSRDAGGSGLGLAIARQIAVSHDGSIDIDSIEGAGSTFTLRIPLAYERGYGEPGE